MDSIWTPFDADHPESGLLPETYRPVLLQLEKHYIWPESAVTGYLCGYGTDLYFVTPGCYVPAMTKCREVIGWCDCFTDEVRNQLVADWNLGKIKRGV